MDLDPDSHQNVTDPEHYTVQVISGSTRLGINFYKKEKGKENSHLYSLLDTAAVRKSPGIGIVKRGLC